MQFFVIVKKRDTTFDLRRLDVENQFGIELGQIIQKQGEELLGPLIKRYEFQATYRPSKDSFSFINNFPFPNHLQRGLTNPEEFDRIILPVSPESPPVKALVAIKKCTEGAKPICYFQHFDKSNVLQKGKIGFLRGGILRGMTDPGMKFAERLTAVITEDTLFFRSYGHTNQFIDLSTYFREATDLDISQILKHRKIAKTDVSQILSFCTPTMRKKFSVILATKILEHEKVSARKIQSGVKKFFDFSVEVRKSRDTEEYQIVFPIDQIEAGRVLEYLTESVYESELTGEHWASNSHRKLKSNSGPE
jgi:hypothetical protein